MRVCPQCDLRTDAERCPKDGSVTVDEAVLALTGGGKGKKDPNLGRVIADKYRLVERLGAGGFATVYRAVHQQMGGDVAIKVMASHLMDDESSVKRFYLEAQNTHKLRHPNTVRVTDFGGTDDGTLYLVMEYLPGVTLRTVVEQEGRLSAKRVVHIIEQVLKSLGEAHSKGLVHRDIKPDNVMLLEQFGEPDFVKVLDFGISRALDSARLTSANGAVGTPKNMAPEQWKGEELDGRTDLYAVGVMMYGLLTGEHPFNMKTGVHGTTEMIAYMNAHLMERPQPLLERTPGACPQALADFVHRLLEKDMAKRPANAEEALRELGEIAKAHPLPDEVPEAAKWASEATAMMPSPFADGGDGVALADQATRMLDTSDAQPGPLPGPPPAPSPGRAAAEKGETGGVEDGATRMMSPAELSDVVPRAPAAVAASPSRGAEGLDEAPEGAGGRRWVWAAVGLVALAGVAVYVVASGLGSEPKGAGGAGSEATREAVAHAGLAGSGAREARVAAGETAALDASAGAPDAGAAGRAEADGEAGGDVQVAATSPDGAGTGTAGADTAASPGDASERGDDLESASDGGAKEVGAGPWTVVLTSEPAGASVRAEGLGVVGTTPLAWTVPGPLRGRLQGGAPLVLTVSAAGQTGAAIRVTLGAGDFAAGRVERAVKLPASSAPGREGGAAAKAASKGSRKGGKSGGHKGGKSGGRKGGRKGGKSGGHKGGHKGGGWGF